MAKPRAPKPTLLRRILRGLRFLLLTTVGLYVVYLVAGNVFLSSSLFDHFVNASPADVTIRYRTAWTLLPGRVHAEGLSIRGRDSSIEWIVRIDEVDFRVSLWGFTHKTFKITQAEANAYSMRVRPRLEAPPKSRAEYGNLPPIEGLPPYGVKTPKTPADIAELTSDDAYHLWTIEMENLVVKSVRELWVGTARFEGDMRADGEGFYFKPLRRVEVYPAKWMIREGAVNIDNREVAAALGGFGRFSQARFDPRTVEPGTLFHGMNLDANVHAWCRHIRDLNLPLPEGLRLTGAVHVKALVAHVRNGVLQEGTWLDADAPAVGFHFGPHHLGGALRAEAEVRRVGEAPALIVRGEVFDVSFSHDTSDAERRKRIARSAHTHMAADARALDLAAPLGDLHVVVDTPDATVPDLAAFAGYIPAGTPLTLGGGSGHASARLEAWFAEHRASGQGEIRGDDLDAGLAKLRVRGSVWGRARFEEYDWSGRTARDVIVEGRIAQGTFADAKRPGQPLVAVRGVTFDAHASRLLVEDPLANLVGAIRVAEARVEDPLLFANYLPDGPDMKVRTDLTRLGMDADLVIVDHRARGRLGARSAGFGLEYGPFLLLAELRAAARVHNWDWEHGDLALDDATVSLRGVRVATASEPPAMEIDELSLRARSPTFAFSKPLASLALTADVRGGKLRDAAAVNAFLPSGTAVGLYAEDGTFESRLVATLRNGVMDGKVEGRGHGLGFRKDGFRLLGDAAASADVEALDFDAKTLTIHDARASFSDVRGRVEEGGEVAFRGQRLDVAASSPFFDILHPSLRNVELEVAVDHATIPDARAFQPLLGGDTLAILGGSAEVNGRLHLSAKERRGDGMMRVAVSSARAKIGKIVTSADADVLLQICGFDPERSMVDVSGSRALLTRTAVASKQWPTEEWKGAVRLPQATFQLDEAWMLHAKVDIEADNANPVFAFLFRDEFPGAFVGLTRTPYLNAKATLDVGGGLVAIQAIDLHAGNLAMRGLYASRDDRRRAALVVDKGPFSAGLRVYDDSIRLRLFGLDGWFRAHGAEVTHLILEPKSERPAPRETRR